MNIFLGFLAVGMLAVIVLVWGRWFLELFRAQRDGRMDPDELWPPGRTDPRDDVP